jgi:hypothetical protein
VRNSGADIFGKARRYERDKEKHEDVEIWCARAIGASYRRDDEFCRGIVAAVVNRGEERERMTGFVTFKRRRARQGSLTAAAWLTP